MYWRGYLLQCTCVVVPNTGVPLECDSFLMAVIKYGLRIINAKKLRIVSSKMPFNPYSANMKNMVSS
jgi:hypothetical protein